MRRCPKISLAKDCNARGADGTQRGDVAAGGSGRTRPQRWRRQGGDARKEGFTTARALLLVAVGIWGGFLQAGVGVLLLMAMVMVLGKDVARANVLKRVAVSVFTLASLPIFITRGQVNWPVGLVVAPGAGHRRVAWRAEGGLALG
ncbi:sulfite exporter TauE/SafE family protein [Bradymonadaceae bacterium TMQ3]|nr:sulfite exporter TauE/SafE family protein [Bradymonadaceae bacterium TMQ3]TXC76300.1 sulfite exporter TauE/SafE family protein [Bradymonadales bacterium TMQ1]